MHLEISYRGGPEAWYEIRARGVTIRRPGHIALHDLMCALGRWETNVDRSHR